MESTTKPVGAGFLVPVVVLFSWLWIFPTGGPF
jgi:hypothetical protein